MDSCGPGIVQSPTFLEGKLNWNGLYSQGPNHMKHFYVGAQSGFLDEFGEWSKGSYKIRNYYEVIEKSLDADIQASQVRKKKDLLQMGYQGSKGKKLNSVVHTSQANF